MKIKEMLEESGSQVIAAADMEASRARMCHHFACEMADLSGVDFDDRGTEQILADVFKDMKSERKFREMMSFLLGADDILSQMEIINKVADLRALAVHASSLSAENRRLHHQLLGFDEEA